MYILCLVIPFIILLLSQHTYKVTTKAIVFILLFGDENMCIVDTDSKIEEEECWKIIKIHSSLTKGHVENNRSIFPTHLGVESENNLIAKNRNWQPIFSLVL